MTTQTIFDIKSDVKKLYTLFQEVIKIFDNNKNIMISVLLQNLQFDGSSSCNWSESRETDKMKQIAKVLRLIADYDKNDWLSAFVAEEVEMIVSFNEMSELEDICQENTIWDE